MANLTLREHVASDLVDLKNDFDRVLHHIFRRQAHHSEGSVDTFFAVVPPIETWIDAEDKEFHLSMPVPGVKPEALNITLYGNHLTLAGLQREEKDESSKSYLEREFSYDRFLRTVTLPEGVEGEKMTAQLTDGILEITAPIAASALPKKIPVGNGAAKNGGSK